MRVGTLTKFNKKKDLWISRKHPLYMEPIGFKTLYAAAILMHTRLNNKANPFSNFELERLITKGFSLSSKDTITIMNLSKDVQVLIDEIVAALETREKKIFFLLDLYNVSMSEYNISLNEQKSLDLFADLLEFTNDERNTILQFVSSAYCKEYQNCLTLFDKMQLSGWPVTMTDLSYYMLNYAYTEHVHPEDIKNDHTYHFRGNRSLKTDPSHSSTTVLSVQAKTTYAFSSLFSYLPEMDLLIIYPIPGSRKGIT